MARGRQQQACQSAVGYQAGAQPDALAIADLDNDGKLEVTAGDFGANLGRRKGGSRATRRPRR
jgi:hypothetical protein